MSKLLLRCDGSQLQWYRSILKKRNTPREIERCWQGKAQEGGRPWYILFCGKRNIFTLYLEISRRNDTRNSVYINMQYSFSGFSCRRLVAWYNSYAASPWAKRKVFSLLCVFSFGFIVLSNNICSSTARNETNNVSYLCHFMTKITQLNTTMIEQRHRPVE